MCQWCLLICWYAEPALCDESALEHKSVSILLKKSHDQWLIALFDMDYPSKITADLVCQMAAAIVKRDNIKNLGQRYDALAKEYPDTADAIAEAAKYAAGPVYTSFLCFLSNL